MFGIWRSGKMRALRGKNMGGRGMIDFLFNGKINEGFENFSKVLLLFLKTSKPRKNYFCGLRENISVKVIKRFGFKRSNNLTY